MGFIQVCLPHSCGFGDCLPLPASVILALQTLLARCPSARGDLPHMRKKSLLSRWQAPLFTDGVYAGPKSNRVRRVTLYAHSRRPSLVPESIAVWLIAAFVAHTLPFWPCGCPCAEMSLSSTTPKRILW